MDLIAEDSRNIIINFLRPIEYAYLNKYYYDKSKEIMERSSLIITRNVRAYFIQIKTINNPVNIKKNNGVVIYKLINSTPVYISIYLRKFYPKKITNGALVFYVSNLNRYDYEIDDNDLIKILVFVIFYMDVEVSIKLSEVLRILPKKYYLSLYNCFIKYKILNYKSSN